MRPFFSSSSLPGKKLSGGFGIFTAGKAALLAAPVSVCALVFISCSAAGGGVFAARSAVEVTATPAEAVVARGGSISFFAEVEGTDNQTAEWEILESGKSQYTRITDGQNPGEVMLTVARDEPLDRLTVRAAAEADTAIFRDIAVTVSDATVDSVTVWPPAAQSPSGGSKSFTVTVAGENNPPQAVKWDIVEAGKDRLTVIEDCGTYIELKVSENETLPVLTLRATSPLNERKFGVTIVTVTRGGDGDDPDAEITGVTVNPPASSVTQGENALFTAAVSGTGNFNPAAGWSLAESVESGRDPGTGITSDGILTVNRNERLPALTVRAVSLADPSIYGEAIVTVIPRGAGPEPPDAEITGVTVEPQAAEVTQGGTEQFTAAVSGTGSFDPEVVWSVDETGRKPGTGISAAGVLTVAADETLTALTVQAVSSADSSVSVEALVTVIPAGSAPEPDTYTVIFDSNGGSATASQTAASGGKVTRPADPVRSGYTFAGWYKNSAFTTAWDFTTDTVTADITLYAKWTVITYTITYNADGGSKTLTPTSYTIESAAITLPAPVKTGYIFGGWYTDSGFTGNAVPDIPQGSTGNRIFYAKWTAGQFTVIFDSNYTGAPAPASKTVTFGRYYGQLPARVRTGYTLDGWFTAASGGTQVWAVTTVERAENHTLYAHWTAKTVTVRYEGGDRGWLPGDAIYDGKTVTFGQPYGLLPAAADFSYIETGYTFAGWWTEQEGCEQITETTIVTQAAEHTIHAHWTGVPVASITFTAYSFTLATPGSARYPATVLPENASNKTLSWSSDNENVATVDTTGRVTAGQVGAARITARATDGSGASGHYDLFVTGTTVQITLNKNSGSGGTDGPITATYEMPLPAIAVPSMENYVFEGYYRGNVQYYTAEGKSARNCDSTVPFTLIARWSGKPVTVQFRNYVSRNIVFSEADRYRTVRYGELLPQSTLACPDPSKPYLWFYRAELSGGKTVPFPTRECPIGSENGQDG